MTIKTNMKEYSNNGVPMKLWNVHTALRTFGNNTAPSTSEIIEAIHDQGGMFMAVISGKVYTSEALKEAYVPENLVEVNWDMESETFISI